MIEIIDIIERLRNAQVAGGLGPGRASAREWRRPGLSPSRKNGHLTRNQEPKDFRSRIRTQGGEAEVKRRPGDQRWANPQGLIGTWSQAKGGKGVTNEQGKRRQMQACGAGRRVEQQRLRTRLVRLF